MLGQYSPFVTYYVAVLLSAWIGGTGPALLALVGGGLLADILFIGNRYALVVPQPYQWVSLIAYALVGLTAIVMAASIRKQKDEILDLTIGLDKQVQHRTKELSEERAFLASVLEHATDGIVACDKDGKLRLFNKTTREFHGLPVEPIPPEEWAGRYSLYAADGETPLMAQEIPLLRALRDGEVRGAEIFIAPAGGTPIPVSCTGSRIQSPAGEELGAVVIMHDVSDTKLLEQRNEELSKAYRDAEGFNYAIAHDLRSPLRAIMSTASILAEDYGNRLPPEAHALLQRQISAAGRMGTLVDDLLEFSRLGLADVKREDVDLTALANVIALKNAAENVEFVIHQGLSARGDASMLELLLQNIFENAVKFTEPGKNNKIEFGRGEDGTFYVRDSGIGFNPAYADKLFLPFERLHTTEQYPGTGIGLANVKRVAERHGGSVWLESAGLGEGATVFFRL